MLCAWHVAIVFLIFVNSCGQGVWEGQGRGKKRREEETRRERARENVCLCVCVSVLYIKVVYIFPLSPLLLSAYVNAATRVWVTVEVCRHVASMNIRDNER